MALPIGKLSLLIGAGVVGSILAKEGRIPSFSDVLSGALKVALKPIQQNDSAPLSSKPRNDALIAQVNSLRQELKLLASSSPVTIVTSRASGGRRYGVIIVIVALGCGYVWWKGWKIPDFMFATTRSLKDACNSVANELDGVFHSVDRTKKELSSTLDESSSKCDDIVASTATTRDEVADICEKVPEFNVDILTVKAQIRTLESKMGRMQTKQDETKEGVGKLLLCTLEADNRLNDLIQEPSSSASRPALEHSRIAVSSRTVSLPPALPLDLPSPSTSNGSSETNGHLRSSGSASNVEEYQGISDAADSASRRLVSNRSNVSDVTEKLPSQDLTPRQPVRSPGFLSRTISATLNFKFP